MVGTSRSGALLVVVTLSALLIAAAAVFLVGTPQSAPGQRPPPSGGELVIQLPLFVWGLLFLMPLIVGWGLIVVQRVREGRARFPFLTLVSNLLVFLVALILLALLLHAGSGQGTVGYIAPAPPPGQNTTPPANNSSPPGGSNATTTGGYVLHLPTYVLWLAGVGFCVLVAVLAAPGVISWLADRRREHPGLAAGPPDRVALASAMAEAASALERGEDPRETVIRLYLRLLGELAPRVGELAFETPDEIRRIHLAPLGVPPAAAEALTRLFEESRYSTHPIDAASALRAREAMRLAEAALLTGGSAS